MAGQRRTKEQIAEAVELARTLLLQRTDKRRIKAALRSYFGGSLAPRSIERYLARARAMILGELGRGKAFLRALSLLNYEQIIADPSTPAVARVKALTRIDKLMGLEDRPNSLPPLEVFLSFLPAAMAEQIRQALREHLRIPAASANGDAPPPPPPPANGHGRNRLPLDPDPPPLL
jgi:hypothetical protein